MVLRHLRCTRFNLLSPKLPRQNVRSLASFAESASLHANSQEVTMVGIENMNSLSPSNPGQLNRLSELHNLGVRPSPHPSVMPPLLLADGVSQGGLKPEPEDGQEISDQEWEIRTGRAIYVLQQTLPDFFSVGLISSLDTSIIPRGEDLKIRPDEHSESIYSPRIRLEYRPPVALPTPFPSVLHVEGLHLYIASSVFVRHTLNALYQDMHVQIRRVRVHGPRSKKPPGSPRGSSEGSNTNAPISIESKRPRSVREKSFFVGLVVTGAGRVSGARAQWEVNCTYTFSPITGLIQLHTVDSIEPAPHQSLFEALGRFGLVGGGGDDLKGTGGAR